MKIEQAIDCLARSREKMKLELKQIEKSKGKGRADKIKLKTQEIEAVNKRINYLNRALSFSSGQYVTNLKRDKAGQIAAIENPNNDSRRIWVYWEESQIEICEAADLLEHLDEKLLEPKWQGDRFIRQFDGQEIVSLSVLRKLKDEISDDNQALWVVKKFNSLVRQRFKIKDVVSYRSRDAYFVIIRFNFDARRANFLSIECHVYENSNRKVHIASSEIPKLRVLNPSQLKRVETGEKT